ncbi:MAG TPA: hypothetical protein VN873_17270 [Candidatus Angelobacter sp.]|nr:hypothetical protein [Candidatus Angelobacter sp.]
MSALIVLGACGCRTRSNDKDKLLATFRVHVETEAEDPSREQKVPIYRASPVYIQVEKEPFLTEAHVASARVLDFPSGGFDIFVQLNRQGTWLLQEYSASNPGKHYAIFSQFGEKGKNARWLAAPEFKRVNSAGILQFTPDCSREEADEIVTGLNNVAKQNESNERW